MLRKVIYGKVMSCLMLIAFCAATIIFQNMNLKNYYSVKAQQKGSITASFNGQLGLLEEENQTTPTDTMEEEDDNLNSESIFLAAHHFEIIALQYVFLQEKSFEEHHLEIVSPPPKG
jgi:hypothetical protein